MTKMYCDIVASIKTYFRCCVSRENTAACTLKKTDSDATTDGERSPVTPGTPGTPGTPTFDDLTASTSSSNSSSSSSSGEYQHNQYLSQRIQSHNNKLFHPFLYHTGGTATIP